MFASVETNDIALQDMSRGSDDPDMGIDAPGSGFRRFIIGVYCVVVLAFVIAMVSMISLPKNTLEMMAITWNTWISSTHHSQHRRHNLNFFVHWRFKWIILLVILLSTESSKCYEPRINQFIHIFDHVFNANSFVIRISSQLNLIFFLLILIFTEKRSNFLKSDSNYAFIYRNITNSDVLSDNLINQMIFWCLFLLILFSVFIN